MGRSPTLGDCVVKTASITALFVGVMHTYSPPVSPPTDTMLSLVGNREVAFSPYPGSPDLSFWKICLSSLLHNDNNQRSKRGFIPFLGHF